MVKKQYMENREKWGACISVNVRKRKLNVVVKKKNLYIIIT